MFTPRAHATPCRSGSDSRLAASTCEQLDVQQVKALADNAEQRPTLERELAILEGEGDLDEGEPGGKAGDAAGD